MEFLEFAYGKSAKLRFRLFVIFALLFWGICAFAAPSGLPYDSGLYGFKLTSGFNDRRGNEYHRSWDIALPSNTPIFTNMSGKVRTRYNHRAGLFVQITEGDYEVILCHLSENTVLTGTDVRFGHLIGYSGDSGEATGPHLHYQVKYKGNPVNPQLFIKKQK